MASELEFRVWTKVQIFDPDTELWAEDEEVSPQLRERVTQAWREWATSPPNATFVEAVEAIDLERPLPPGYRFIQVEDYNDVYVARVAVGLSPLRLGQYEMQLLYLPMGAPKWKKAGRVLVGTESRYTFWGEYQYFPMSMRAMLEASAEFARLWRLPFERSLRAGMPSRKPDRMWVGFSTTDEQYGWWVKVYREWSGVNRKFSDVRSTKISNGERAVELAQSLSKQFGIPIDWTNAPFQRNR